MPGAAGSVAGASIVRRAQGPEGVTLVAGCTPTGPELCFNAIDDNCNGVFDEGCGQNTGLVQFMVAWGDSPADVNLDVTVPGGERVGPQTRSLASGFHYERDCPENDCHGQNTENVYFDGDEPPRGDYTVRVSLADLRGAHGPVAVRFGARLGPSSYGADLLLEAHGGASPKGGAESSSVTFTYTVGPPAL